MKTDWTLVVQDMCIYILSSRSSGVDEDGLDTSCAGHVYIYTYCPLDLVKWMRTDWILVVQDM